MATQYKKKALMRKLVIGHMCCIEDEHVGLNWAKSFDISKYMNTLTVCSSTCLLPGNLYTQIQTTENIVF